MNASEERYLRALDVMERLLREQLAIHDQNTTAADRIRHDLNILGSVRREVFEEFLGIQERKLECDERLGAAIREHLDAVNALLEERG